MDYLPVEAPSTAHLIAKWRQVPSIAHRDVKIENVLLDCSVQECLAARGRVVLCDFGSATTRAQVWPLHREQCGGHSQIQGQGCPIQSEECWTHETEVTDGPSLPPGGPTAYSGRGATRAEDAPGWCAAILGALPLEPRFRVCA